MFIDTPLNPNHRAPEERDGYGDEHARFTFRSSGAGRISWSLPSINITSLRDEGLARKTLSRNSELDGLFHRATLNRWSQVVVVVLCAAAVKLYYSTASVNELRWILAPTTFLVELVSGSRFEFESHSGYMKSDHSFVIAASCAGVNFLITSFLLLTLRKLWRDRSRTIAWEFIPAAALFAYLATLVANTARISIALLLHRTPLEISWLSPNQLHRFEGIFVYFGFLLLLFLVSEKMSFRTGSSSDRLLSLTSENSFRPFRRSLFPLLIYYAITLGIPLANGAYREGNFLEHALFVLLTPLLMILPIVTFHFYRAQRSVREADD